MLTIKTVSTFVRETASCARLGCVGFTFIWPFVGIASVKVSPSLSLMTALFLISCAYGYYGYMTNDLIDLEGDRSDPSRTSNPLICGSLSIKAATVLALAQLPLMAMLHISWGFPLLSLIWLALSVLFLTTYNLYSKSCRNPFLTEVCLATGAIFLTVYGASIAGEPGMVTLLTALCAFFIFLLGNGIYNQLRDVDYELILGRRTLATYLGSRGTVDGKPDIPRTLCWYGRLTLWISCLIAAYIAQDLSVTISHSILIAVFFLFNFLVYEVAARADRNAWNTLARVHMFIMPLIALAPFVGLLSNSTIAVFIGIYFIPVCFLKSTKSIIGTGKYDAPIMMDPMQQPN